MTAVDVDEVEVVEAKDLNAPVPIGWERFCRLAFEPCSGTIELVSTATAEGPVESVVEWAWASGPWEATVVFDWMADRRDEWQAWVRLVDLFGHDALSVIVVEEALAAGRQVLAAAEAIRRADEERRRLHEEVDLFLHDERGKHPRLSLESGDEHKPFFVMRFTERWERDRVVDWLRWQKGSYVAFRDLVAREGAIALEREILSAMRAFEAAAKKRGIASGGRRPLRFWRGE